MGRHSDRICFERGRTMNILDPTPIVVIQPSPHRPRKEIVRPYGSEFQRIAPVRALWTEGKKTNASSVLTSSCSIAFSLSLTLFSRIPDGINRTVAKHLLPSEAA